MKKKRSKHVLQMVVSALVMVAIVAGYLVISGGIGNEQGGTTGTMNAASPKDYVNEEAVKIRIAVDEFPGWNNQFYANAGLNTKEGSINAKNGLDVEYVIMNNAEESSDALISGEVDAVGYTVNRYALLQSKFDEAGVNVVMPYISNYSNGSDGIIASSDIMSVEDLVGKKIAVPRHSEAQTLLEWLLRNSSLTPTQIEQARSNIVYFESAEETGQAFFRGEVDAAATWEPYLTQAASSTDSRILFDTSMGTNLVLTGLVFRQDFLEKNEEAIVKLIDGVLQANSMYMKDFTTLKSLESFELLTDEELAQMCSGSAVTTWADNVSLLSDTAIEMYAEMANIWISVGEPAVPSKAESAFDNKYINQLMGKYPAGDVTSFTFSEEGRQAATQISNNAALLSVTLNIEFQVDSYKISRESYEELNEFAKTAEILNGVYIQIEGNTAKVPGDNGVDFSYRRALSVAKYLQALGIDPDRFIIIGNGDTNPVASNETEEGRAQNRRTEVFFKVIGY